MKGAGKMRARFETILAATVALCVGAAAGWFAARAWGKCKCENVEVCKYGNMKAANARARSPSAPDGSAARPLAADTAAKPRRKVEARAEKRQEPVKEEAKSEEEQAEQQKKDDNPFPRYLDMFRNDPEALAAEFLKEADKDRASQRKMRDEAVANLKLNAEQAAFFEKALDDLVAEITQQNREWADLVASGKLNEETADGAIWSSNPLLAQRMVAAREAAVRETGEKLYENLVLDGVSDAEEQRVLRGVVYQTSFSYECYVPDLAVYDKVYKNMGFGTGIFSWCIRQSRK